MKTKSAAKATKRSPTRSPVTSGPSSRGTTPALRLKRLLVTTDFSEESKLALTHAAAFAERLGGEIALLHVVEPPPRFVGVESLALISSGDATMGRVLGGLEALAKQAFKPSTRVTTHARPGHPARVITKTARELETDLLIMATHGYSGLKHTLLGSTTERVIRNAPCPVLVIRSVDQKTSAKPGKTGAIQRVIVATDFSDNSMMALPLAQALAKAFGAGLTLMHVVERVPIDPMLGQELTSAASRQLVERAQTRLAELASSLRAEDGSKLDIAVRFGKPFDELARGAKELDASLIVIATHGYSGIKHALLGSVAERVLRHAPCPVLVVRESNPTR